MKIFNPKSYSLITKSLIIFLIITILLIFIRTFLSQSKIKEKYIKNETNFITQCLLNTRDLLKNIPNINPNYRNFENELKLNIKQSLLNNSNLKTTNIELFYSDILNHDIIEKEYKIGKETILTWIIHLSSFDSSEFFFLKYSINKNELEEKNNIERLILFLLPETLIAMGISFFLLILILKRMLNNIDKLTKKNLKSLEEKEILLKEIHHRVKNNFALTISLIELQEEEIEDKKTKKILRNIQERIYTMELLHRKLYESSNLAKILFKNYIIDLVNTIKTSYDSENKVSINFEIENINLNIESAMPYGLILNELITNSFKYAFKQHSLPQLKIHISKEKKTNQILLIIKDNGEGLKENFINLCNKTLGLKLINMIIKHQLRGDITYKYEDGAKFIIRGKIIN